MPSTKPYAMPLRDWKAIGRDYAACILSVPEICMLYGMSEATLYNYARREGWALRSASGMRARPRMKADLSKRLLTALELKMTQFERRMMENAAMGGGDDNERDVRTLNTLVGLFDKLKATGETKRRAGKAKAAPANGRSAGSDVDKAAASATPAPADTSKKDAADAKALREALAQRLERLRGTVGR